MTVGVGTITDDLDGGTSKSGTASFNINDDDGTPTATLVLDPASIDESGDDNATTVTATLSGPSSKAVTLTVAAAPVDPAISGDFTLAGTTLTIAAGATESTGTVTITAVDNNVDAANKTVTVSAVASGGGVANPANAPLTITDDDTRGISVSPVTLTLAEVDDPSTQSITEHQKTYTVELDSEPTGTVTVDLASGDTTIATLSDNSLEFTTSDWDAQTVTVTAAADDIDNTGDERTVRITHTVSATGTDYRDETAEAVDVTVTDDDGEPTLSIDSPSVAEGNRGTATMTFKVTLSPASGKPVSVTYADAATGTATSATDYAAITGGTLNFAVGETEKTVTVTVNGDTTDEPNETVVLRLSSPSNAAFSGGAQTLDGTGTITDDDGTPVVTLKLASASITEDGGSSTVTATLSGASSQAVTLTVAAAPVDPAVAGDYTLTGDTLTIAAGATESTGTVTITAVDNDVDAANKSVTVSAVSSGGGVANPDNATLTITDNDTRGVTVSAATLTVDEVDDPDTPAKEHQAAYTVVLDSEPTADVRIDLAATGGAVGLSDARLDFTPSNWNAVQTVTVTAVDDDIDNPGDARSASISHTLVAGDSDYAGVNASGVTATVTDDDDAPDGIALTVDTDEVAEDAGKTSITVTATVGGGTRYSADATVTVTIGQSTDSAVSGTDYARVSTFDLVITAGEASVSKAFDLTPTDDALDEADETISVTGESGSLTVTGTSITLADDDVPELSITAGSAVTEGTAAGFTVNADIAPVADLTVNLDVATTDSFAASGTTGSKTLTFRAGRTSESYTVGTQADTTDEPDGSVAVTLEDGTDYSVDSSKTSASVGVNDDDATTVALARAGSGGIAENGGKEDVTVTLGRALVAGESVTVPLSITGATVTTHYTLALKGTGGTGVSLLTTTPHSAGSPAVRLSGAGAQTATLTLTAVANTDNASRTVSIAYGTGTRLPTSSGLSGGISTSGAASVPILDDDAMVSVAAASAAEGSAVVFTVTLPEVAPSGGVSVGYSTSDGRGNNDDDAHQVATSADYTAAPANSTLTIAQGQRTGTVSIPTTQDTTYEGDHYFTLNLDSTSHFNLSVAADSAIGTITDAADAPSFAFSIASTDADEDDGTLTLTVEKTGTTLVAATVSYATTNGTATGGSDFTAIASTNLSFAVADTSKDITVSLTDDSADEPAEAFTVDLTAGADAQLGSTSSHTVNITDNDATTVTLGAPSAAIKENAGTKTITVTLGRALTGDETLDVPLTFSGTATFGTDYTLAAPNSTPTGVTYSNLASTNLATNPPTIAFSGVNGAAASATVILTATSDTTDEGATESVTVGLGALNANSGENLDGGASGSGTATFEITDDDGTPTATLVLTPTSIDESGDDNTTTVTATLSGPSSEAVTLTVAAAAVSPAVAADFTLSGATLTIAAGETTSTGTVTVTAVDNEVDAPDKSVTVSATASGGGVAAPSDVTLTITDDDERGVTVTGGPLTMDEADKVGTAGTREDQGSYTVVLTSKPTDDVRIDISAPSMVTLSPTSLTFTPSNWNQPRTVTATAVDDAVDNTGDARTGSIAHAVVAGSSDYTGVAAASVMVTVNDDDGTPVVRLELSSASIAEDGGSSTVTASLSGTSSQDITLTVAAAAVSPAVAGDFALSENTTLTIAAGSTTSTGAVTITAVDNDVDAANKTVTVSATATGGNGVADPANATLTITDDDERGISVSPVTLTLAEADDPSTQSISEHQKTYSIELDSQPTGTVTVSLASGDTTIATLSDNSLEFTASDWDAQTVTVTAVDDAIDNAGDARTVRITHTVSATGTDYQDEAAAPVDVTVTDDDGEPTLSIDAPSVTEGNSGTATLTFKVTLSPASGNPVSVAYADATTGTATSATDYAAITSGTLNFAAGDTEKTVTVTVNGDTTDEPNETVVLRLSSPSNAVLSGGATTLDGTGTITDDDATPTATLVLTPATIDESGNRNESTVTATLSGASSEAVTLTVNAVAVSPAVAGDFTLSANNTLTIAAGSKASTGAVTITAVDNSIDAPNKSVTVSATTSGGGVADPDDATLTITDDDAAPTGITLAVDKSTIAENAAEATVTVTASVTGSSTYSASRDLTITVGAGNSTAVSGEDYTAVETFTLTLPAGAASATDTFDLEPLDDDVDEDTETITVTGTDPGGVTVAGASIDLTDNDTRGVTVAGGPLTMDEADNAGTADTREDQGSYTVVLTSEPTDDVRIDISAPAMVGLSATSLTFTPSNWNQAQTVTATAVDDTIDNAGDERAGSIAHAVVEGDSDYAGVAVASVAVTVNDDDGTPTATLVLTPTTIDESGDDNATTVTATLSGPSSEAVTLTVAAAAVSPALAGDFTLTGATLTIAAGATTSTGTVTVTAVDNGVDAPDKSVTVSATATGGGVANPSAVTLTITDDDTRGVTVTGGSLTMDEADNAGTAGTREDQDSYTVVLDSEPSDDVKIDITAPAMVTLSATSLTFTPSDWNQAQTVTATAVDDSIDNAGDARTGSITHAVVAGASDYTGVAAASVAVTVNDDDGPPTGIALKVDKASVAENAGSTAIRITAEVTGGTAYQEAKTVQVHVGAGTDSAVEGTDYTTVGRLDLTIAAGAMSQTYDFNLVPSDDDVDEDNETISVTGTATSVTVTGTTITLTDDDTRGVSVSPVTLTLDEADDGATPAEEHKGRYTVELDSEPTGDVSVDLSVPEDAPFTVSATRLDFTPSNWSNAQTVTVTATDDNLDNTGDNRSATISHTLSAAATDYEDESADSVAVTVNDDDAAPMNATLTVDADAGTLGDQDTIGEGAGETSVKVTVSIDDATRFATTQTVSIAVGKNGDSAVEGTDYDNVAIFNLPIQAGAASGSKSFNLTPTDDDLDEGDESLSVEGTLAGLTIAADSLTIKDDDTAALILAPTSLTVIEGASSTYTVKLATAPTGEVTVTIGGFSGTDLTLDDTSLTFTTSNWKNAQTVTVSAGHDADKTSDSATLTLSASGGGYASISANLPVTTSDDEAVVTVGAASAAEGSPVGFTVTLPEAAPAGGTVIDYSTSDGRGMSTDASYQIAVAGSDYTAAPNNASITIAQGQSSGTISIATSNDSSYEGDHHFTLTLDAAAGFDISPSAGSAIGTITDAADTPSYAFSAAATTIDEDDGTATLRVQRTGDTEVPATLSYATANGTAMGGSDFTAIASTNLAFTAAETNKTFTVAITDDSDDEPAEAFSVNLSVVSHAKLGSQASHTVNITDDDATSVTLAAPAGDIAEKNGGKTITVTLGRTLEGDETLAVPLAFGGAAAFGDDYTLAAPNSAPTGVSYENLASTNLTTSPPTIKFTGVDSAAREATLTLSAVDDVIDENGAEPVTVGLGTLNASSGTNLGGGASGSGSASFNINDDDSAPGGISLSVDTDSSTSGSQTSLAENAGKTSVTVMATVNGGTAYQDDKTVEITVGTSDDSAAEGEDYVTVGELTLTIPAGATTREISFDLTPTDDAVDENDEVIRIEGESGDITVSDASITLNDNDEKGVSVSKETLTIEEVDDGSTPGAEEHKATYSVGLDSQPTGNVRVTLNVPNGAPFTASPPQLNFTPSSWGAQTVTVTAVDDSNSNAGGKRSATITHALTASGTDYDSETVGSVAVTVNDDDDAPMSASLSVDADADSNGTQTDLAEGGGAKNVRVTATFSGSTRFDTAQTIAVTVGAITDSATKDTDYSSSVDIVNITIAAGAATGYKDFTLTPTDDDIDEADESISLVGTLSGVTFSAASSGSSISLTDDDERGATLSGTSLTVNEVDTAATTDTKENEATYTLAFDSQPTAAVRVNLSVPNGAPVTISPTHLDFTTSSWGAKTVTVTAVDDDIDNPNNRRDTTITHALVAGSSDYGTVTVPNVSVRVNDDDAAPGGIALSADISSIAENAATQNVLVTATVSGSTAYSEAKTIEVEVGGSSDSAVEGTDYAEVEKFSITINAGAMSGQKSFSLNPTDDVIDEPNETIGITGTTTGIDVDGASISITDNDAAPTGITLSVSPASVAEDAAATTVTVTATITGGTTYAEAKTVRVAVGDGNDSATEGTDYKSVGDFDLGIAAGAASAQKTFSLAPTNDARDEADERISVTGTATGITFVNTHVDLTDDEGPPTLSIDSPTVAEGADGTTARLRFNVRLSAASDQQVTVDYSDRGTGTADSATDYATVTAGTLTFAVGDTVKHIDVTVNGDDVDESNETVILRLSSPSNAGFAGNVATLDATGTVTDDDTRGVSVSPTTLSLDEQDDTSTASKKEHQGTFAVALTSEPVGGTVTVNVASGATGTATVSPQSLTFNASNWQTAQNVTVTAVDDAYDNTDDVRKAIITNTVSASGTDYSGETASSVTVTVNDDDSAPMDVALSVDTKTLAEGAGATSITVTAMLQGSARFAADKTVRITVGEDTDAAVSGTDYKGVQAFDLTITAGQASGEKSFTLEPTEDVIDEPSESLRVTGKLAGLTVAPASISITDNDAAPTGIALSVNTTSVGENAAATSVTVTADVRGGTTYGAVTAVSVIVGAAADSAGEGADYARVDEFTIDIPAGAASASGSFDLAPVNDLIAEPTESLSVSGKSGDLTVTAAGNIEITDDDDAPTASLVLSKTTIDENGGSASLSATISGPSSQALTLAVSVDPVSPMTTSDFTIVANPVLTIPAGETSSSANVAVTAVDNDEDHAVDDKQLRLSATASGGLGIADPDEVTLTIKDDDKAGVNFSTNKIEVEKDETTVIQVRLTSQPTMDTTVILTSNNPNVAELSASPRGRSVELLFTPENWNVPQPVTVHGMDDGEVSIDTTIQSADPMYAKAPVPKPLQTNVIGVPNLTLTAGQDYVREGNAATFTIEADRVSAVDVPVKIEVGYLDCCIGTGEILAEGEYGVRTVTLPQGDTSVSFKVQTADDDEFHGEGTRPGNKSIYARIVETDAYRIDHEGNDELARFTWQDSVSVRENDPIPPDPPADIIVSVSGPERVVEGDTAEFTFTASKAPESDLVIDFYLDSSGDFETSPFYAFDPEVLSGLEKEAVTLSAGALETTFSLTIIDDADTQGHGRMSVRVSNGRNNSYDSADPPGLYVFFDVIDDETSPPGESEGSQQEEPGDDGAACVSAALLDYVEERIAIATTDRWERIKNALTGRSNVIELAEVREIYERRKANGWTINRLDEVIAALECLEERADLRVEDARVTEAPGAVLRFDVRLVGTAGERTVTVAYATEDGIATAGADYQTVKDTLTFAPGETVKTVTVPVTDDGHDEGAETMTLALSSPEGAALSRAKATGTIENTDPMPWAWLARFGRTVAEQVVEGVSARFEGTRSPGFEGRVGGASLTGAPAAEDAPADRHLVHGGLDARMGGASPGGAAAVEGTLAHRRAGLGGADAYEREVTLRELLMQSDFTWTGEADTSGGSYALWGRMAESRFDGSGDGATLDGEVTTGLFGMDFAREDWLAGVAVTHSDADGRYTLSDGAPGGEVEATLDAVTPYGHLRLDASRTAWGVLGFGMGTLTLTPTTGSAARTDLGWQMAAAGLRDELVEVPMGGGFGLSAKSDVLWARTTSEAVPGLVAAEGDVTRLRVGLEGGWTKAFESGATLAPRLDVGARHDGGDAETGWGIELGTGLAWQDAARGLDLSVEGRGLVHHESGAFRDRGYSASLTFDPAPGSERGLSVTLKQEVGASASGGMESLFSDSALDEGASTSTAGRRWTAEAGYGRPALGGRFTGVPYVGYTQSDTGRDTTLGVRLAPGGREALDLSLDLKATRRRSEGEGVEHGVGFELGVQW